MNGNTFTYINGVKYGSYDIAVEMAEIMIRQENTVIDENDLMEFKNMNFEKIKKKIDFKWDEEELLKELNPTPSEKRVLQVELLYLQLQERYYNKSSVDKVYSRRNKKSSSVPKRPKDSLPFGVFKGLLDEAKETLGNDNGQDKPNDNEYVRQLSMEGHTNEEIEIMRKKREIQLIRPKIDKFNKRFLPKNAAKAPERKEVWKKSYNIDDFERMRDKREKGLEIERNNMINLLIQMKREDEQANERFQSLLKESKQKEEERERRKGSLNDAKSIFLAKLEKISKVKDNHSKAQKKGAFPQTQNSTFSNEFFLTNFNQNSFAMTGYKKPHGTEEGSTILPSTLRNEPKMASTQEGDFNKKNESFVKAGQEEDSMKREETLIGADKSMLHNDRSMIEDLPSIRKNQLSLNLSGIEKENDASLNASIKLPLLNQKVEATKIRAMSNLRERIHFQRFQDKGTAKRRALSQQMEQNEMMMSKSRSVKQEKKDATTRRQKHAVENIAKQVNTQVELSKTEFLNQSMRNKNKEFAKKYGDMELQQYILANAWGSLPEKRLLEVAQNKIKESKDQTNKDVERFKNEQKITDIFNQINEKTSSNKTGTSIKNLKVFKRKLFMKVEEILNS